MQQKNGILKAIETGKGRMVGKSMLLRVTSRNSSIDHDQLCFVRVKVLKLLTSGDKLQVQVTPVEGVGVATCDVTDLIDDNTQSIDTVTREIAAEADRRTMMRHCTLTGKRQNISRFISDKLDDKGRTLLAENLDVDPKVFKGMREVSEYRLDDIASKAARIVHGLSLC